MVEHLVDERADEAKRLHNEQTLKQAAELMEVPSNGEQWQEKRLARPTIVRAHQPVGQHGEPKDRVDGHIDGKRCRQPECEAPLHVHSFEVQDVADALQELEVDDQEGQVDCAHYYVAESVVEEPFEQAGLRDNSEADVKKEEQGMHDLVLFN